jgi:hypothetical protein
MQYVQIIHLGEKYTFCLVGFKVLFDRLGRWITAELTEIYFETRWMDIDPTQVPRYATRVC